MRAGARSAAAPPRFRLSHWCDDMVQEQAVAIYGLDFQWGAWQRRPLAPQVCLVGTHCCK